MAGSSDGSFEGRASLGSDANDGQQANPATAEKRERFRRAISRKLSRNRLVVSTEPLTPGPGEVMLPPQMALVAASDADGNDIAYTGTICFTGKSARVYRRACASCSEEAAHEELLQAFIAASRGRHVGFA